MTGRDYVAKRMREGVGYDTAYSEWAIDDGEKKHVFAIPIHGDDSFGSIRVGMASTLQEAYEAIAQARHALPADPDEREVYVRGPLTGPDTFNYEHDGRGAIGITTKVKAQNRNFRRHMEFPEVGESSKKVEKVCLEPLTGREGCA